MKVSLIVVVLLGVAFAQEPSPPSEAPEVVTQETPVEDVITEEAIIEPTPEPEQAPEAEPTPEPELEPSTTLKPTASPPGDAGVPGCLAPGEGGLQAVLNEFAKEIPVTRLYRRIIRALSTDRETQQVLSYVSSAEFHDLLIEVIRSPELIAFVDYACQELFLDVRYYFNMLLSLFALPEFPPITSRASPGFRGLFLDILDLIPTERLKSLVTQRMVTDPFLQQAYSKIRSPEFSNIYETLANSTAYNQMINGLRAKHIDVDIVKGTIRRSFL